MEQSILRNKLISGETVYLLDDFEDVAIRLVYDGDNTKSYIKHKGRNEVNVPQSNETVCGIVLGGKEISKHEYDKY